MEFVILAVVVVGVNTLLWGLVGLARFAVSRMHGGQSAPRSAD